MQVCTSLQTDNHASTPPLSFLQAGCPSCRPTISVKALKATISEQVKKNNSGLANPGSPGKVIKMEGGMQVFWFKHDVTKYYNLTETSQNWHKTTVWLDKRTVLFLQLQRSDSSDQF